MGGKGNVGSSFAHRNVFADVEMVILAAVAIGQGGPINARFLDRSIWKVKEHKGRYQSCELLC